LKREYGADSKIAYEVMSSIGAMHANKETARSREMDASTGSICLYKRVHEMCPHPILPCFAFPAGREFS
jgi:hypothetical protein